MEEAATAGLDWILIAGVMLLLLGFGMVIVEVFVPALGLFGITGIAAMVVGTVLLHQNDKLDQLGIGLGTLAGVIIATALFGGLAAWLMFKALQKQNITGPESLVTQQAEITQWNERTGKVRIQGEIWQAYSDDAYDFIAGDHVLVTKVQDLHLKIRPL